MLIPCRTSCGFTGPLGYLTGLKVNYRCVSCSFSSKREAYRFNGRSVVLLTASRTVIQVFNGVEVDSALSEHNCVFDI